MKFSKLFNLFMPGCLAVILLAGCFNPITAIPPKTGDLVTDPFTVDIFIGQDGSARTVAGLDPFRIKGDNIRNFVQLVVVDLDDQEKNIVGVDEDIRRSEDSKGAVLSINSIAFGKEYAFLLLMGHWQYVKNYKYYDGITSGPDGSILEFRPPTLLAAGLKTQKVSGSGKITVVMWPLVVDTELTTENRIAELKVNDGKPETVSLLPIDWGVNWTVNKGLPETNGFEDLIKAQKVINAAAAEDTTTLQVKDSKAIVTVAGQPSDAPPLSVTVMENVITLGSMGSYTAGITKIGTGGSVQFNLEYVPFNLNVTTKWSSYIGESKFAVNEEKIPVWIIRNGINDYAQNPTTDFTQFGNDSGLSNGNGGVSFVVTANPEHEDLVIKDGDFEGYLLDPNNPSIDFPSIRFTTAGYGDGETAEVYYAVVKVPSDGGPTAAPPYTAYTNPPLGSLEKGDHTGKQITLPDKSGNYDVYVILFQDGKVSLPTKINTKEGWASIGSVDPIFKLYVKSDGANTNIGEDKDKPLSTVKEALDRINSNYEKITAAGGDWPNNISVSIVILETVTVDKISIGDDNKKYPPIVLSGGDDGILRAKTPISISSLLSLSNSVRVTLEKGLRLDGMGVAVNSGSLFTMNGGEISGNSAVVSGVAVNSGSLFTMNGGEISSFGNSGVSVHSEGTFNMNGGEISGNSAQYGGGVYVKGGNFKKTGGVIYGGVNEADPNKKNLATTKAAGIDNGNAVYIAPGMFPLDDNIKNSTLGKSDLYSYP
jgi:hypothetical protein